MAQIKVTVDYQSILDKIEYDLDTYRIENTSIDNPKDSKIVLDVLNYALNVACDAFKELEPTDD